MKTLTLEQVNTVSGAGSDGLPSNYCLASAVFLGISPLGGPWTVAGAGLNAWGACF